HPTGSLGVQKLLRPYPPAVLTHKSGTVRRFYGADARHSSERANLSQEQTDVGHHLGVLPPPGPPALPRLTPPAKAGHRGSDQCPDEPAHEGGQESAPVHATGIARATLSAGRVPAQMRRSDGQACTSWLLPLGTSGQASSPAPSHLASCPVQGTSLLV